MIVDCEGCVMRDVACGDCVVTFLLGPPQALGSAEQVALATLADGGLVPPLRMRASAGSAGDSNGRTRPVSGPAPGRGPGQASGAATA